MMRLSGAVKLRWARRPLRIGERVGGTGYGPDLALPSLRATLLPCIEAFGSDRAMFATDYPVGRRALALRDICERFNVVVADFSAAEQSALFHDTAAHLYRFDRA